MSCKELQIVIFLSQKKTKDDINVLDPNSDVCKLLLCTSQCDEIVPKVAFLV